MLADKPVTLGRKVKWLHEDKGQILASFKDPFKRDSQSALAPAFAFFVVVVVDRSVLKCL